MYVSVSFMKVSWRFIHQNNWKRIVGEPDECRTATTCSAMTMQQCLSRGNCDGFGLCSQVPAFGTHACKNHQYLSYFSSSGGGDNLFLDQLVSKIAWKWKTNVGMPSRHSSVARPFVCGLEKFIKKTKNKCGLRGDQPKSPMSSVYYCTRIAAQ